MLNRPARRPDRRIHRRVAVAGAVLAGMVVAVAPVAADTPDPYPWPASPGLDPGIDATAHSLRIAGADRAQTALSSALLLRGNGSYPFGTSDRTSGAADGLATASQWWGLGTCPFAVIITAGDTASDSLAAASLSDPTDGSTEPVLERTTTADPFLDPLGERTRVDTDSAPIIVTASARQGARNLSAAAFTAIADLADGACRTVDSAIVVGGTGAVPAGVDQQLLGLGVDQVFRVAGEDRYGTAAAITRALGTGEASAPGTACADPDVGDGDAEMGFHGNAAVEFRTGTTTCAVLGRTVVLTDGITGADALAAGWWTSTWQVPVLLTDGEGGLPPATLDTLSSLVIDNVVVLGGRGRIPDATVADVGRITGAATHRVAGDDRYATSVQMARTFGGWFPTGDGRDHDGSMVCLAASSGSGASSIGWPDALGAGPWCAKAGGLARGVSAPVRGLPPVSGPDPRVTRGLEPSHDAVPVLLTPVTSSELAQPVADLLAGTFDPADVWCSSIQGNGGCLDPGFAFAFGGTAVLSDGAVRRAARAVSGQTYVVPEDQAPFAEGGFWTGLDLGPVYGRGGAAEEVTAGHVCTRRDSLVGVRMLTAYADLATTRFLAEYDLFSSGRYVTDRDGVGRSPGDNAPVCLRVPSPPDGFVNGLGTSVSGHTITVGEFAISDDRRLELSGPVAQQGAEGFTGADATVDGDDGTATVVTFSDTDLAGTTMTSRGDIAGVAGATIEIRLVRGSTETEPDTFEAVVSVSTTLGAVTATAAGEALFDPDLGTWSLRGSTDVTGGTWNATDGLGGFRADLVAGEPGGGDDDLAWRIDALLPAPAA